MLVFCLIAVVLSLLAYVVYKKGNANSDYFVGKGIPSQSPKFLFGNASSMFLGQKSAFDYFRDLYCEFPSERLFGTFFLRRPAIVVRDPELVKQLFVKEFDHFTDHQAFLDETKDSLLGKSLFNLTGQKWRDMRTTLSPAFTGSKMRLMFESMVTVGDTMVEALTGEAAAANNGVLEYEMKDFSHRFATDIIAICAFGITVDSFKDRENQFFLTGKKIGFDSPPVRRRMMGFGLCPALMKLFRIELFDEATKRFFRDMVVDTIDRRAEKGIVRPDMISLLMQAKEGTLTHNNLQEETLNATGFSAVEESEVGKMAHKREWTMEELIAQCFIFFVGGFDTISSAMSFACYELAVNEDVQEKLFEEIWETESAGKITYDRLFKMKYLDMVVSETLRRWPPGSLADRQCVKAFEFDDQNGFKYQFDEQVILTACISGFHSDPKYFPEPERFDPERFSEANRPNINPDVYLPFGIGPRNCIASRFALMEIKVVLYKLILDFQLKLLSRTDVPMVLSNSMGVPSSKNGIWLALSKRKNGVL